MAKNTKRNLDISVHEERGILPTHLGLPSGVKITPYVLKTTVFSIINPFFILISIPDIVQLILNSEVFLFNKSEHNIFRETLVSHPGFVTNVTRPVVEDRFITTRTSSLRTTVRDESNERGRYSVPITFFIWIIAHLLAYAPSEIRSRFTEEAIRYGYVPTFISEVFKRTRQSYCGDFFITPTIAQGCFRFIRTGFSEYVGTFLDPSVLFTPGGIASLISFFAIMNASGGNYIPFTAADTTSLPPLQSGYTTKFNSISLCYDKESTFTDDTEQFDFPLNTEVCVVPGHSYGNNIESVHVTDAHLIHQVISEDTGFSGFFNDKYYLAFNLTANKLTSTFNSTAAATHIVMRVTGVITNKFTSPSDFRSEAPASDEMKEKVKRPDKRQREQARKDSNQHKNAGTAADAAQKIIDLFNNLDYRSRGMIFKFINKMNNVLIRRNGYEQLRAVYDSI